MKFLLYIVLAVIAAKCEDDDILKEFINNNVHFTADVYKEMITSHPGNFLVCPLSVQIILALVLSGATGNTAKQLSTALHLPENHQKIQNTFTTLSAVLQDDSSHSLTIANKAYIKEEFQIKNQFKNIAVNTFTSEIQNIDFSNSLEAADEMNNWVKQKTHDKIKDLISSDDLNDDTRMVLINAVYFKGTWLSPFTYTEKFPFKVNKQKRIDVDMMYNTDTFGYYKSSALNAKFLEMAYANIHSSMIVILPDEIEGLQALEEIDIADILATPKFSSEHVDVQIPKFKIGSTIEFKPILQTLGIVDAFADNATFSKISEEPVKISKVIQKTFIEVDEKGTTAAAATAVYQRRGKSRHTRPHFIADHPFMYIIKSHGVVLFIGCYKGEQKHF